jgi:hypothetical protein
MVVWISYFISHPLLFITRMLYALNHRQAVRPTVMIQSPDRLLQKSVSSLRSHSTYQYKITKPPHLIYSPFPLPIPIPSSPYSHPLHSHKAGEDFGLEFSYTWKLCVDPSFFLVSALLVERNLIALVCHNSIPKASNYQLERTSILTQSLQSRSPSQNLLQQP